MKAKLVTNTKGNNYQFKNNKINKLEPKKNRKIYPKNQRISFQNPVPEILKKPHKNLSPLKTFTKTKADIKISNISTLLKEEAEDVGSFSIEEPSTNIQIENNPAKQICNENVNNERVSKYYDNSIFHEPKCSNFLNVDLGNLSSSCSNIEKLELESLKSLEIIDFDNEINMLTSFENCSNYQDIEEDYDLDNTDEFTSNSSATHRIKVFHTRDSKLLENKKETLSYLQTLLRVIFHKTFVEKNVINNKNENFGIRRTKSLVIKRKNKKKRIGLTSQNISIYKNISKKLARYNSLFVGNKIY